MFGCLSICSEKCICSVLSIYMPVLTLFLLCNYFYCNKHFIAIKVFLCLFCKVVLLLQFLLLKWSGPKFEISQIDRVVCVKERAWVPWWPSGGAAIFFDYLGAHHFFRQNNSTPDIDSSSRVEISIKSIATKFPYLIACERRRKSGAHQKQAIWYLVRGWAPSSPRSIPHIHRMCPLTL